MELQQLEYFLQLTKYQNVSMTADFINISQPALSKHLAQLEQELGVKLFDRIGRNIYLNEYGKTFAQYVEQSLMTLNTGKLSIRHLHKTILGTISIGLYSYGSIISPCISKYSKENPLVNFRFTYKINASPQYSPEDIDFLLCSTTDNFFTSKDQFWVTQPLFKERYIVVVSPLFRRYPQEKTSINLLELRDDPFIVMSQNEGFFTDVTYKYCNDAGFAPKVLFETDDFLVKMKFLQEGLCVALIPESCLQDAKTFIPQLRYFNIENFNCERTMLIKRRKKIFMPNVAKSFWDFLLNYYHIPLDTND